MKKTLLLTLMALLLCVAMMFGITGCALFTQNDIDTAVNEATSPLNDKISELEGQIADLEDQIDALDGENEDLESEKEALESEKAALEAELAKKEIELACTKGEHAWDGESELEYSWSSDKTKCTVLFDCAYCDEKDSAESKSVTVDENGNIVAEFDGGFPSDTCVAPFITGVMFNTDSEDYDEATNTFAVSEGNSFVITFIGKNFDMLNEEKDFAVGFKSEGNWYYFDEIYTPVYEGVSITIEEDKITYIWDYDITDRVLNGYGINQIEALVLCDYDTLEIIMTSMVEVNLTVQKGDTPTDEWVTVTTAEELREAVAAGGNIRFGADIESETGFLLYNNTIIDLAGYDLKVTGASECTFWSYADSEVTDSVGGSILYNLITANSGTLKFSGAIQFEYSDYAINGSGNLDLSGYTGDKLYIYATNFGDVILPDGYAFYSEAGEMYADFAALKESGVNYVYIRPDGGAPTEEWVTVITAEEFMAAIAVGGNIRLGASIDTGEEYISIDKETVLDLDSHILSTSFWSGLNVNLNVTATVKNGTVQNLSEGCCAITSYGNLTVENCVLKGRDYLALMVYDNRTEVKSSTLDGGVTIHKGYTESAELYAVDNVTVIPGEWGIVVDDGGTATFAFDPTEMLNAYSTGVVTDNGDGTYTVKVN